MIYANVDDLKDHLKQDMALNFGRKQSKDFNILTQGQINHNQIHHIRNNWLRPEFFLSWR